MQKEKGKLQKAGMKSIVINSAATILEAKHKGVYMLLFDITDTKKYGK